MSGLAATFLDRPGVPLVALRSSCAPGKVELDLAQSPWRPLGVQPGDEVLVYAELEKEHVTVRLWHYGGLTEPNHLIGVGKEVLSAIVSSKIGHREQSDRHREHQDRTW